MNSRTTSVVDSLLESEDYEDVQRYLNLVPSKPQLKRYTREQIKHFLATRDAGELLRRELETPPSEPHQMVGEAEDPEVDHYLSQVRPLFKRRQFTCDYCGQNCSQAEQKKFKVEPDQCPSCLHRPVRQIVREAVDPLDPEPSMGEVDRHLPTKEVRLRGNTMLFAPNIIRMAQNEWQHGRKKQKAWALELIKSWQGLPDQLYLDILNGKCDITEDGDDAVIVIRQY